MTDPTAPGSEEESAPLFSLVSGEGDGFMLGLAAGDTAGGAWKLGYSAYTEQATVISYHLIESRAVHPGALTTSLLEMDGSDGEAVYRAETPEFRDWLNRSRAGSPVSSSTASAENLVRACPVGAAFRHDADEVVIKAIELSTMFTSDAGSVIAGVVGASSVAAAAFGQSGRDFVAGVSEAVLGATDGLGRDLSGHVRLEQVEQELHDATEHVGVVAADEVQAIVDGVDGDPLKTAIAGLVLAAPMLDMPHRAIEEAARLGGSVLGAFVGAVVGARVGIRAWPWPFANDTWFAEIGRRVVRGPDEVRDLPIPYAVEQHLISGSARGYH